ncbi:MAG: NUDIX hydrolase, partial [Planctomycetota bacterium JB042]
MLPLLPFSLAIAAVIAPPDPAPAGWTDADTRAVLDKTLELRFAPDLSGLEPGERRAVEHLLAAGAVVQELYEEQLHHRAAEARAWVAAHGTDDQRTLFRLFEGPIGTTLDNRRAPFLDVDASVPGRNVYPWGVARDELEAAFADRPERREALLHLRSVVRRRTPDNVLADREALRRRPALAALHPEFERSLVGLAREGAGPSFYAVPYAVRFAPALDEVRRRLRAAAAALEGVDDDFAQVLRLRATDLLTDDYEAGDAAWITGSFGNLNAQIGAYETYDDALFGVKAFFGLSILVKDAARSRS